MSRPQKTVRLSGACSPQSDGKIIVQICMELMRGGSLRDNLLVLKRKGQLLSLKAAFNRGGSRVAAPRRGRDGHPGLLLNGICISFMEKDVR